MKERGTGGSRKMQRSCLGRCSEAESPTTVENREEGEESWGKEVKTL